MALRRPGATIVTDFALAERRTRDCLRQPQCALSRSRQPLTIWAHVGSWPLGQCGRDRMPPVVRRVIVYLRSTIRPTRLRRRTMNCFECAKANDSRPGCRRLSALRRRSLPRSSDRGARARASAARSTPVRTGPERRSHRRGPRRDRRSARHHSAAGVSCQLGPRSSRRSRCSRRRSATRPACASCGCSCA